MYTTYSIMYNIAIEKTFIKAAACELSAKVLTGYNLFVFGPATKSFLRYFQLKRCEMSIPPNFHCKVLVAVIGTHFQQNCQRLPYFEL